MKMGDSLRVRASQRTDDGSLLMGVAESTERGMFSRRTLEGAGGGGILKAKTKTR